MGWIDRARRASRQLQKTSGPKEGAYLGLIDGYNPERDRVTVSHLFSQEMRVKHPYLGLNSWIRVGPETGTGVLIAERWDSEEHEILSYYDKWPEIPIERYAERLNVRRPIKEGEIELSSIGWGQIYADERGNLHLRGGMVWSKYDNDNLRHTTKAPLHQRQLAQTTVKDLGDEERFGIVVRPGLVIPTLERYLALGVIPFKEYYRSLASERIPGAGKLVEHHEGDVLDREGLPTKTSAFSGLPLRGTYNWFTDAGEKSYFTIDNIGNVDFKLATSAIQGANLKIPAGRMFMECGLDFSHKALRSTFETTGGPAGQMTFTTTGNIVTTVISLDGVSWRHAHPTSTGLSGPPQTL